MRIFYLRQNGFTLLEVLVASALLAVILAALYSTFFLSNKAISGLDESMIKLQESRKALDMLRKEIESSFYRGSDEKTLFRLEDRDIYGRQTSRIIFTSFSPLRPGVSEIKYYVKESGEKLILCKEILSPLGSSRGLQEADIIEGIGEFSIEAKYGDRWVKTWDSSLTKKLPDEIRISLGVKIKDRHVLLFEKARPMMT